MKNQPKTIFGDLNQSPVWALDGNSLLVNSILKLHPGQLVCILQRSGHLTISSGIGSLTAFSGQGVLFLGPDRSSGASLTIEKATDSVLLGFDRKIMEDTLHSVRPALAKDVQNLVFSPELKGPSDIQQLPQLIRDRMIPDFRQPPVGGAAASFWFESRVREVIALCFFHEAEPAENFFCSRQKRVARERIEATKRYISANLDQPFDLKATANVVGCSAHHLSRTFSEMEGLTIIQFLRRIRIQRAAELLSSGRYNVSEAALEVGYQSLSHFSKAFQQEKGVLPSRYDFGG